MLDGPRADRHGSDDPAFWCRGEAPQLAEGDFTLVRTCRLAPPPVCRCSGGPKAAGRFHDPEKWGESVGARPDAGVGGRKNLLGGKDRRFWSLGKTGTRLGKIIHRPRTDYRCGRTDNLYGYGQGKINMTAETRLIQRTKSSAV